MKTAISMDDGLLLEADRAATNLGLSRSRLFARAVREFLERQRQEQMLRQLNEVYATPLDQGEMASLKGIKSKFRKTLKDRW